MSTDVLSIRKTGGIAGQLRLTAVVRHEGEDASTVSFVGSIYGGPVLMQTEGFPEGVFVTDPTRFGQFSHQWIERFFA